MKKIGTVVLVALALATTAVLAEQLGEQRTPHRGMMGMMQGMMNNQKSGESMQGLTPGFLTRNWTYPLFFSQA